MTKKRVVVTGASGYIIQRMFSEFAERYELVALDNRDKTSDGQKVPGIRVCDLTQPDRDSYREHFKGADAIIHCAFVSAKGLDATTWADNSEQKFRAEHAGRKVQHTAAERLACRAENEKDVQ